MKLYLVKLFATAISCAIYVGILGICTYIFCEEGTRIETFNYMLPYYVLWILCSTRVDAVFDRQEKS